MRTGNERPRKKKIKEEETVEATPTSSEETQAAPESESFDESIELT